MFFLAFLWSYKLPPKMATKPVFNIPPPSGQFSLHIMTTWEQNRVQFVCLCCRNHGLLFEQGEKWWESTNRNVCLTFFDIVSFLYYIYI